MKKYLILLVFSVAIIAAARSTFATTQQLMDGQRRAMTTGTNYVGLITGADKFWSSAENAVAQPITTTGTLSHFLFKVSAAPSSSSPSVGWVLTLMKNGSATNASATIMGANTTSSDLVTNVTSTLGDMFSIRAVSSGTPALGFFYKSIQFVASTTKQSIVMSGGGDTTAGGTTVQYHPINGTLTGGGLTAVEANAVAPIPTPGTISNLFYKPRTSPGAGTGYAVTLMLNRATTTLTCTGISSASCSNTTTSIAVVAGDLVDWRIDPVNTPGGIITSFGATFTATTDGESLILGSGGAQPSVSGENYSWLNSGYIFWDSTEASEKSGGASSSLRSLYVYSRNQPGVGKNYTLSLRQNGTNSTLKCVLGGATNSCVNTTSTISVVDFDILNIAESGSGTPATTTLSWGIAQYDGTPSSTSTSTPSTTRRRSPMILFEE